jgi:uncharacterized protein (DUF1015 family)
MAEVIPFQGVLYNPQKVNATSVVAPPYDIVTPEFKDILYNRSPYNIIRIDFGKDKPGDNENKNRYTRASQLFDEWLEQGIFIYDSEKSFYCYEAIYRINGSEKRLRGFLGTVRIEELGTGHVHPHEMTYSKPKSDRLNILRFCRANISPIFSLYSSQDRLSSRILEETTGEKPYIEAKNGDGFLHRLWRISDRNSTETITRELSDREILIADGHHRYETALEFKHEMNTKGLSKTGSEPFNYVLMLLVNIEDDGLSVLPTHRLVNLKEGERIKETLAPYFDITTIPFDGKTEHQAKEEMFTAMRQGKNSLGMFIKGSRAFEVLHFKGMYDDINTHQTLRSIDVSILHKLIFEKLLHLETYEYEMDADTVIEKVLSGPYHTAFFLNPTKIQDVKDVALAGQRMPPKSTYFYPKLLTGMVIYKY